MSDSPARKQKKWYSLTWTEWFVLVSVIFILINLSRPPSVSKCSRRSAACSEHLQLIVSATHAYLAEHGSLPPLYTTDKEGKPLHSWRVLLLPYFTQPTDEAETASELYKQIKLDEPWDSEHNKMFHRQVPYFYRYPGGRDDDSEKNCRYIRLDSGNDWAVTDEGEAFCWMNPSADIPFEELRENAEEMKNGKRLYGQHWTLSWRYIPIVNMTWSDGKAKQIREHNLADELREWKTALDFSE
ncbi:MAG: DUF1559 domain-containing protein [Planctomycetaceae bacterium]|jgi:hypothetical protein|nr:DUF1559 domain-containing protein [Planctomycetaceae bacterium]